MSRPRPGSRCATTTVPCSGSSTQTCGCLIVELKARKALSDDHIAQVLGYLRASGFRDAMLINFGSPRLQVRKFVV
ncbi:MAG: GxxExxY protein [Gemmatimonadales bacterium]|nr:GxxExxY protein [Gemmatimonadales bacterium]